MTIFTKIINKEIPASIVYEDEHCLCFKDIHPQAPVHLLLIPKKPIRSLAELSTEDQSLMGHLLLKASEIARNAGLDWSQTLARTAGKVSIICTFIFWASAG
jgi:histidine triad (HIT) family protein